jgi:hypothetical protein
MLVEVSVAYLKVRRVNQGKNRQEGRKKIFCVLWPELRWKSVGIWDENIASIFTVEE